MIQLMQGDCLELMQAIPDGSVNCCVTSPPYYGLRSYGGGEAEIGLEKTPEEYIANLVKVFREVKRVLRDDGTLWVNIGDSYAGSMKGIGADGKAYGGVKQLTNKGSIGCMEKPLRASEIGLKNKDLIGIPWMLAFALRADGWYLRQDIIWSKPNPMPESVKDRCTKAHEYIFLFSKKPKYYFDSDVISEDAIYQEVRNGRVGAYQIKAMTHKGDGTRPTGTADRDLTKRNKRSVWTVNTKPYKGAHFAAFPSELIEPCILAGCPQGGTVLDPFAGSGTVGGVANKHLRKAILCELNEDYCQLIADRVRQLRQIQLTL